MRGEVLPALETVRGGQRIHHMDLGGACQVQIPGTDGDLVRSRPVPSGVDTAT